MQHLHSHTLQIITHRSVSACRESQDYKSIAEELMDDPSSSYLKNLKLIPASASVIPPHPSVDDSAVPLASLGADWVWELVHETLEKGASRSGSVTSSPLSDGHAFGTIGAERSRARQSTVDPLVASLAQYSLSNAQTAKNIVGPLTPTFFNRFCRLSNSIALSVAQAYARRSSLVRQLLGSQQIS